MAGNGSLPPGYSRVVQYGSGAIRPTLSECAGVEEDNERRVVEGPAWGSPSVEGGV